MTREEAKDKAVFEAIDYFMNSNEDKLKALQKHIDKIFDEYEKELKQSYIDGSNSNNELIKFYLKRIEELEQMLRISIGEK